MFSVSPSPPLASEPDELEPPSVLPPEVPSELPPELLPQAVMRRPKRASSPTTTASRAALPRRPRCRPAVGEKRSLISGSFLKGFDPPSHRAVENSGLGGVGRRRTALPLSAERAPAFGAAEQGDLRGMPGKNAR